MVVDVLVVLVAVEHLWFLVMEMFLWTKPLGLRTFRMTPEDAAKMRVLAANQGLYNGFLAAGLVTSFFVADATAFRVFFLTCVVLAGVFGGFTVSRRILVLQAVPAAIALGAVALR